VRRRLPGWDYHYRSDEHVMSAERTPEGQAAWDYYRNLNLTYRPAPDSYARHRCGCGHLFVAPIDTPGGNCPVPSCGCARHESVNHPAPEAAAS
jgi:hypothetical protein